MRLAIAGGNDELTFIELRESGIQDFEVSLASDVEASAVVFQSNDNLS